MQSSSPVDRLTFGGPADDSPILVIVAVIVSMSVITLRPPFLRRTDKSRDQFPSCVLTIQPPKYSILRVLAHLKVYLLVVVTNHRDHLRWAKC